MSVETKIEACAIVEGDELVHKQDYYIVVAKAHLDAEDVTRKILVDTTLYTFPHGNRFVVLLVISESDGSKWILFFKDSEEVTILERPQMEQS